MIVELSREQMERVLHREVIGRIGCHAEGKTYVVPITYVYDGDSVYGHSAEGLKLQMMRKNPRVCFEVDHLENLVNWQSVIAWGEFEELKGQEALAGMQKLVNRLMPLMSSETAQPTHGQNAGASGQASIYRIRLEEMTGRFEKR